MRAAAWLVLIVALSSSCGREDVELLPVDASTSNLSDGGPYPDAAESTELDANPDADATEFTPGTDGNTDAAEFTPGDDGSTEAAAPTDASDGGRTEDATDDAQATDAPVTVDVVACPLECNGGCGPNGTTCMITISTVRAAPIDCPPGLACRVHCVGDQTCPGVINCAAGQPCTVVCDGDEACTSNTINQGAATSLCVECLPRGASPGCNAAHCSGTCTIHCVGSCSGSCANCTSVSSCP